MGFLPLYDKNISCVCVSNKLKSKNSFNQRVYPAGKILQSKNALLNGCCYKNEENIQLKMQKYTIYSCDEEQQLHKF